MHDAQQRRLQRGPTAEAVARHAPRVGVVPVQVVLFEDLLRRGAVIEVVIDLRPLDAVARFVREIEVVSAGAGMILAVAAGGDQERHFGRERSCRADRSPHRCAGPVRRTTRPAGAWRSQTTPPASERASLRSTISGVPSGRAHAHQQALLLDRDLQQPRAQAQLAGRILGREGDRLVGRLRARSSGPLSTRRKWNVLGVIQISSALPRSSCSSIRLPCGKKASSVATAASACGGITAGPSRAGSRRSPARRCRR